MNRALLVPLFVPALWSSPAVAAVVIYGGPTYDAATGTGYLFPNSGPDRIALAGNSIAACCAQRHVGGEDAGTRAVRWDTTGATATELDSLGGASDARAMNVAGT